MKLHITIPKISPFQPYFDAMQCFSHAAQDLGYHVTLGMGSLKDDAINIIFAPWGLVTGEDETYQMFTHFKKIRERCILFNLEQPVEGSWVFKEQMLDEMRKTYCFDYYDSSVDVFKHVGVLDISCVKFLYDKSMELLMPHTGAAQDIDILFFGGETVFRNEVISELHNEGLKVTCVWAFGADLWEKIQRSKIILNIPGHPVNKLFEAIRCVPIVANGKPVVSLKMEHTECYPEIENAIIFTNRKELPNMCKSILENEWMYESFVSTKTDFIRRSSLKAEIKRALSEYIYKLIQR